MNIRLGIPLVVLTLAASIVCASGKLETGETTISIVLDRYSVNPELERPGGFSCVIQMPVANILFDTGYGSSAGKFLLSNMEKMNIDPLDIDIVVISHSHLKGGLMDFLERNPNVTVCYPGACREEAMVENYGAKLRELDKFTKIAKHVYSTGGFKSETDPNIEQSLVIDTEAGLVVVCGCAHPGIINVLERVMASLPNKNLHLVMGGFHLESMTLERQEQILQRFIELGVDRVSPCSCSGGRFREIAEQEFEDNYIECGVGLIIRI